ncbi:MAG: F0F1 ATP synthase subunit epsilon [Deltaproteobacteria bacterium]|nr:F0F1 ATP synthase subunit epsilon [Deltaproteobacteria bacterium]
MADTFLLEIVTPYRKLLSREVDEVTAPGWFGEFGVLAGHTQYLTVLKAGELSYKKGSEIGSIAVGRGYAEVLPDKTTILVENAETAPEIDIEEARAVVTKSEEALKTLSPEDAGYGTTVEAYELAQARIKVKEKRG